MASTTRWSWAWVATEVAIPAGSAAAAFDQCAPPSDDSKTSLAWVSLAGLVVLVQTRTSRPESAASRAPVGCPLGPGAPGWHGTPWLATVQAVPVIGPLSSSPDGASR